MAAPNPLPAAAVTFAVRRLLPAAGETLLLRAALDRDQGAAAWATWRANHDLAATLATDRVGLKGLLPLLAYQLEANGARLAPDDLSLLRMARYRETLRSQRYQTILHQTLTTLTQGGIPSLLLKGAALAPLYPEATLRHCHDIDLLVHPHDLARAAEVLLAQGFSHPLPAAAKALTRGDLRLDHSSGLPVLLHTRLYRHAFFGIPLDDAWRSALPSANQPAITRLAPEWELVHILGVMLCAPQRARVTWVCDVHYLLAAHPTIDWPRVCAIAEQSRLAMATYLLLDYLQQQQLASIRRGVFEPLSHHFAAAGRAEAEQVLQCSHNQGTRYRDLYAAAAGWQERGLLLRWIFSARLAAWQRRIANGWQRTFSARHPQARRDDVLKPAQDTLSSREE